MDYNPLITTSAHGVSEKADAQADHLLSVAVHSVCCTLSASKQAGKVVLDNVSCRIRAHTHCAIIGPSGAGGTSSTQQPHQAIVGCCSQARARCWMCLRDAPNQA